MVFFRDLASSIRVYFVEFVKVCFLCLFIGLITRLSIIIVCFKSLDADAQNLPLAILLGMVNDFAISYIYLMPILIYKIFNTSTEKKENFLYYFVLCIVIIAIVIQFGLDLLVFIRTKSRLYEYIDSFDFYKKTIFESTKYWFDSACMVLLTIGVFLFSFLLTLFSIFRTDVYQYKTGSIKIVSFMVFLLFTVIFHLMFFYLSNIKLLNDVKNRYIYNLPKNITEELLHLVLYKREVLGKVNERHILHRAENENNVMIFFVEGLSGKNFHEISNLTSLSQKSLFFLNAISVSKNISEEIKAILTSSPLTWKDATCNTPWSKKWKTLFFTVLKSEKSKYFANLFNKCGFALAQDGIIEMANKLKKKFVFASIINIASANNIIYTLIANSVSREWFTNTLFIFVGVSSSEKSHFVVDIDVYKTPIIFFSPKNIKLNTIRNWVSTIDISPSISEFLDISYNDKSYGESLLSGSTRRGFIKEGHTFLDFTVYKKKKILL